MSYWTFFANEARGGGSPLYARLAEGIGGDDELIALAARVRAGQPLANTLLAAVHFLLLRGAVHPLKAHYPDLGGRASSDEDPFPLFQDFVRAHRAEVERLVETRITNTNEVGRSALLHPGFRALAQETGAPLHLIEIGPSAGLNMIWDRYGVRYIKNGAVAASIAPDASLVIDCELKGGGVLPLEPTPNVAHRVGLERNPVDLSIADDRDWLRALVWPDQPKRMERLARAMELFAAVRPEIRVGDALALLPDALAEVSPDAAACVYHTIAVYQFSAAMKEALENIFIVAGLRRTVWRLSVEYDGTAYPLSLIRYRDGTREERLLAKCHSHGAWLEWLAMPAFGQ